MAEHKDLWGRRDALLAGGWAALTGSVLVSAGGFVRMLFRRAPVEPPSVFLAGRPEDYAPDTVSERFVKSWRVFVVREGDTLYALHAKCTHLGCTPRWRGVEHRFKCPCHGSGFRITGRNFEGPAPRPLDRLKIWRDRNGELLVDVASRYPVDDWDAAEASIVLGADEEGAA